MSIPDWHPFGSVYRARLALVAVCTATLVACADAGNPRVSIVAGTNNSGGVRYALRELESALQNGGFTYEIVGSADEANSDLILLASLRDSGVHESYSIYRSVTGDREVWRIEGSDARGLTYALLDTAERIPPAENEESPLAALEETRHQPFVAVRAVSMYTMHRRNWESRFYDEAYWRSYMDTLVRNRFNTLVLIFGYENGGFLAPSYPYFFDVDGFGDVGIDGMTADEQARNLAALNRMIELAHERGLEFKIAIWDHIYRGGVQNGGLPRDSSGRDEREFRVHGVTSDNLFAYTTTAFARLLSLVPALDGVQFRMHNESGLEPGKEMHDFWTAMFATIKSAAPDLDIELRAKELPDEIIAIADDMELNYSITTKYWMEQMGLPFHPTHINRQNQFDRRHGYADMLRYPKRYDVLWRMWTAGTQRILLWGNPDYVRRFAESTLLYDGSGFEINEPLATKMDGQPHEAEPFDLLNPEYRYFDYEFERYWYYFETFGRVAYDPEYSAERLTDGFVRRFGTQAGPLIQQALHRASYVLPMINAANAPYSVFPTTRGWVAKQRLGELADFALAEGSDVQQFASFDEEAQLLIEGGRTAKRLPSITSSWFSGAYEEIEHLVAEAARVAADGNDPEFVSTSTDLRILANLAHYHARRIPAAVSYRIFERTGDTHALDDALAYESEAIDAWRAVVDAAGDVYADDLMMGSRATTKYGIEHRLSGHWRDELEPMEAGLESLKTLRASLQPLPERVAPAYTPRDFVPFDEQFRLRHDVIDRAPANDDLVVRVQASAATGIDSLHVRYRPVNQHLDYASVAMTPVGIDNYEATIPAASIDPEYDLMYFVEVFDKNGRGRIYPDLETESPYVVVRLAR